MTNTFWLREQKALDYNKTLHSKLDNKVLKSITSEEFTANLKTSLKNKNSSLSSSEELLTEIINIFVKIIKNKYITSQEIETISSLSISDIKILIRSFKEEIQHLSDNTDLENSLLQDFNPTTIIKKIYSKILVDNLGYWNVNSKQYVRVVESLLARHNQEDLELEETDADFFEKSCIKISTEN